MTLSPDYLFTQLFNGLVNGGFFALLALGLSVIFGMLRIVNFAHGTMYMLGAFVAYYGAQLFHLPFFAALVLAPLLVGLFGWVIERLFLRRLAGLDPLYGLLFTFAIVLCVEDGMRLAAGALGSPYPLPDALAGAVNLGFTLYPTYRLFVIAVCLLVCAAVYVVLERTPLGARVRASTEEPGPRAGVRDRYAATGQLGLRRRNGAGGLRRRAERAEHQRLADDG